jgi:hypothetical protein
VKAGTASLPSRAGDVVPFGDSEELGRSRGLPGSALAQLGDAHRLADPAALARRGGESWEGRMKPITFVCEETLPLAPEDIARQILDLARWPAFRGYGPIPGIQAAAFEARTPGVVGSRIRVTNGDGSSHVEEIVEWEPGRRLRLEMKEFSAPLSRLATRFEEAWGFQHTGGGTWVTRSFRLHARSVPARLVLWVISLFLERAVARHLREMRAGEEAARLAAGK